MAKMQSRDLVLAVIGLCSSRPEFGRTSLQKVTYFGSQVLEVDLGHSAYYYGPYSPSVEADAEALVLGGLVSETVEQLGFFSHGYAANQFHYSVTDVGQDRLVRLKAAYPEQMTKLEEFVNSVISVAGSLEQATLSAAAKTLYIAREQGKPVSLEEVKLLASDFGWKLSKTKINQVVQILSQLRLVRVVDS
jgi:uncharacterized protein YwgA